MEQSSGPTLRVIAREAGVSHVTVSLALRNHLSIPTKTRTRIKQVAKRLGYQPNPLVAALMRQVRSHRKLTYQEPLAFLTADLTPEHFLTADPIFPAFLAGAQQTATSLGFRLDRFWLGPFGRDAKSISKMLVARHVRGVIIAPLPVKQEQIDLNWSKFAISTIGFSFNQVQLHRACHHQVNGMRRLYSELYKLGYRRIGFAIIEHDLVRVRHYYLSGYLTDQHQTGERKPVPPLIVADESKLPELNRWFSRYKPDVIISIGWKIYEWLVGSGVRIPQDVAFAQLNLDGKHEGIAGIDQNSALVGATAVELAVDQLFRNEYGVPKNPKMVLLDGEWIPGKSAPRRRQSTG